MVGASDARLSGHRPICNKMSSVLR